MREQIPRNKFKKFWLSHRQVLRIRSIFPWLENAWNVFASRVCGGEPVDH
jgi:hypothetical protein